MADWIRGERSATIAAPPATCFAVLADVEAYPEWQSMVGEIRVHDRDEHSRPQVVETVAITQVRTVRYVMRYAFEPPRRIAWRQLEGDLRDLEGEYTFADGPQGGTHATYRLGILPGRRLGLLTRAPLFPQVAGWFMHQALDELRARCEAVGAR
ncbi:MAG: SRPBCC family protein [Solirubrobacterales bacterium]|nr:SRPBCC family protein [Solirubrobacterales bacterium]MBV9715910.1 SRPBCC family protein [Solirubrobacterales bacterium]